MLARHQAEESELKNGSDNELIELKQLQVSSFSLEVIIHPAPQNLLTLQTRQPGLDSIFIDLEQSRLITYNHI